MTMLAEQGIKLHLLTPLELRLKGSPARIRLTSKLYGFTKDSVVTASGMDQDLRRQLENGKRTTVKKASTMMGKTIAELSDPLECQVCDCLANANGKGRLMCHRCVLPSIDIVLQNWDNLLLE